MATKSKTREEIMKAFGDIDEIQKAAKTNAKVEEDDDETDSEEHEDEESPEYEAEEEKTKKSLKKSKDNEEDDDEDNEDEDEQIGKAISKLRKSDDEDQEGYLKKCGFGSKIAKKAIAMHKKSIKKSLENEFNAAREEVADATEFLVDFNNEMKKGFETSNDNIAKMTNILKSFGRGMLYVMDTLDKIDQTPIQKGVTNAKAIEKSFGSGNKAKGNSINVSENKEAIMKAMSSLAFNGNSIVNPQMATALVSFQGSNNIQALSNVKADIEKAMNVSIELI